MTTHLSEGLSPFLSVKRLGCVVWELQCHLDLRLPDVTGLVMKQWEESADGVGQCVEQRARSAQVVSDSVLEDDVGGMVSGGWVARLGHCVDRMRRVRWRAFFMMVTVHLSCGAVAVGVLVHPNDLLRELRDELWVELLEALVDLSNRDFGCVVVTLRFSQRAAFRGSGPDRHRQAWWKSLHGTALRVIQSDENAAQRPYDSVAQLGGGEPIRKQPKPRERE